MSKVKNTAMGAWFRSLTPKDAALYVAQSLYSTREGVFWAIVEHFDLKAKDPLSLGYLVLEHLMEWDLDRDAEKEEP